MTLVYINSHTEPDKNDPEIRYPKTLEFDFAGDSYVIPPGKSVVTAKGHGTLESVSGHALATFNAGTLVVVDEKPAEPVFISGGLWVVDTEKPE